MIRIPERPLGIGTVRLYKSLMVGLTSFAKQLFQLSVEICFGDGLLLVRLASSIGGRHN